MTTDSITHYLHQLAGFRMGMKPEAWTYAGAEDYVLDRGRLFDSSTPLTEAEATVLQAAAHGREFPIRECYSNAQKLAMHDQSGLLTYCEGFATGTASFVAQHAWVSINDKVIDLTWRQTPTFNWDTHESDDEDRGSWENRVLGKAPEGWAYFGCNDLVESVEALHIRLLRYECWTSFLSPEFHVDDVEVRMKLPRIGEAPENTFAALQAMQQSLRETEW